VDLRADDQPNRAGYYRHGNSRDRDELKMNNTVFIDCAQFEPPTLYTECPEVIWSNGTSCRRCPIKSCYRNGWLKAAVGADNKRLVKELAQLKASSK
jgi:hypothetical protein